MSLKHEDYIERELLQPELEGLKYYKHHINPRHTKGKDDTSNLVRVTQAEHAILHLLLFNERGIKKDYLAFRMISGGHPSLQSYAGKLGAIKCKMNKINCFFDPIKHRIIAKLGAKATGLLHWYNDGIKNIRLDKLQSIPNGFKRGMLKKRSD